MARKRKATGKKEKSVVVVIGNFNGMSFSYKGKPILVRCIEGVRRINYGNYHIVISDLSSDGSAEYIRKHYPGIGIAKSSPESFCAESNNDAIKYSIREYDPDYIVRLDNDILITDREWLTKMVAAAESDPDIGLESCKLLYPDGKIQHAGIDLGLIPKTRGRGEPDSGQYDGVEEVGAVIGAMFFMRRSAVDRVGLIDENLLGLEDVDYGYEMRKHGYKVVYNGAVSAIHLEGFTTANSGIKSRSDKRLYARLEGYSYLSMKEYSLPMKIAAVPLWFLRGTLTIKQKDRKRSIANMRIRGDIFERLALTCKAVSHAMKLYRLRNSGLPESRMRKLRRIGL